MEKTAVISMMGALAQPTRLAVFTILADAGTEGLTAGEIAAATGTPANTMSSHLLILTRAGLATSRRVGRNIFYASRNEAVRELAAYLKDIAGSAV